jgi:murein DD-endopeptidase MepM/ murein hydrolase activator NlpD
MPDIPDMPKSGRIVVAAIALLALAAITPAAAQNPDTSGARPVETHYLFSRPIGKNGNVRVAQGFPFGWHRRNQSPLHHGVDILNGRGTPVIAAADGTPTSTGIWSSCNTT